jgi:hypothetical protein
VDSHLNVFRPYERWPPGHEDQLTRAAMIVMRAVPLARDAFLHRLGLEPSAVLPGVQVDMQTRAVLEDSGVQAEASLSVRRLVSAFLSPDDRKPREQRAVEHRARGQRLDGVLRFGDELVVVIESKTRGKQKDDQAYGLDLSGIDVDEKLPVVHVGWHEVFQDWWGLFERDLLAPAELALLGDLVDLVEAEFPHLLPFPSLAQAGDHGLRRQRRLMALLREATGLSEVRARPPYGAEVLLDRLIGTESTQRVALEKQGDKLRLVTWPAELKPQALAFYGTDRALNATQLDPDEGWYVEPNLHLAFRGALTEAQRLYTTCQLDLTEYVRRWVEEDLPRVRAYDPEEVRGDLWPWLEECGHATSEDAEELDRFLDELGNRKAHLRPGVRISCEWHWDDAVELDAVGRHGEPSQLAEVLREAIAALLTALLEPLPPTDS